jgi:uncharacterized membrane protein
MNNSEPHRKSRPRKFLHALKARPRLLICLAIGLAVFHFTPGSWRAATSSLVAWDVAIFIYLGLVLRLAQSSSTDRIRLRARLQDDGAVTTLVLSSVAATACFAAIALELSALKTMTGINRLEHGILVGATIPMAWLFIHSMFALHYAHEFYDAPDSRGHGLIFPGEQQPSYWDFLYFSLIIGTSGQTADVSVSCASLRKVALVHCVLAFFFNITMLGLTINVASSML